MKRDYYEISYSKIKDTVDALDPIYCESNDLKKYEIPKRCLYSKVEPSNDSYYDYYYEYMGMTRKLTLHDSLINDGELLCTSSKKRRKNKNTNYGIPKKFLMRNLNLPDQPVFNDEFLNKISKQGYIAVYSPKK